MKTDEVKDFFKHDLDHLLALCNRHRRDLLADNVDQLPVLTEERTDEDIAYAGKITWVVGKAIQACSVKSRKILTDAYLKRQLDKITMVEMGYSQARYYQLKQIALIEFADNFTAYLKEMGVI
ncbi:phage transcriptional regulator, ArpU family [Lactobacillus bombicola]|uniref:Phage transcriptional regulator, ArpU family n=1 Tax=Lactobacillus bombicola TaxID=1505723 RepID=A0A1I1RLI6_9LACO|nr:ArpU family phage packaging/lysis transcriptional regulator [Lactobacillus bombicola]SFD35175.1 phage transcriptional regulator, ArpU family [Lactobacillus bombicola]